MINKDYNLKIMAFAKIKNPEAWPAAARITTPVLCK